MFKPIKSQKINENLYAIKTLFVNSFVYDTGKSLIVFDTGINELIAKRELKKLNIDYNKVTHVFLTHSDYDHVAGLSLFKNAKKYISKQEEPLITRKKARRFIMYNRKIKNYIAMQENNIANIDGVSIKIIYAPGHTIGSAMYSIDEKILITGDTITIASNNEIRNFSFVQNMSHAQNKKTVKNLKEQKFFGKFNLIATGHHGVLINGKKYRK